MSDSPSARRKASPGNFAQGSQIAYLLKGYPRTSETFITNEIHLLERLGLDLSIFSLMKLTGQKRHAVVDIIRAPIHYLPQVPPLSEINFIKWLIISIPKFIRSHRRLYKSRPENYRKTLIEALRLSFSYRKNFWSPPNNNFIKEFLQAGYLAERILKSGQVGHLHAHFCHTTTAVAMFAGALCGIPFSFTAHAKDIYLRQLNPGDLLRVKMLRAKFVVTCTRANQKHLEKICQKGVHVHTIYHGLDTTLFAPQSPDQEPGDDRRVPVILSVGRFVEKKGYTYLVQACQLLKEKGHQFHCQLIGGEGAYAEQVKTLIKELNLVETISLRPAVTQEELLRIYRQGTIFVLPCQIISDGDRDGIPNVLVEAMAMELPVVSTNISGIPELIDHEVNGLLVPQKNAAELAEAMEKLLQDPLLRHKLGKAARRKVCLMFDAKKNVVELHDLFRSRLNAYETARQENSR
ncbi:MAG: glycosyltransferase family 4 protein [Pyrinomonadaceae bacterium]